MQTNISSLVHAILWGILLLLAGIIIGQDNDVAACSGGLVGRVSMSQQSIQPADLIVWAVGWGIDATGYNGHIKVVEYLKGTGEEFLLISQQSQIEELGEDYGYYAGNCSSKMLLSSRQEYLLFLDRNADGTYRIIGGSGIYINAPAPEAMFSVAVIVAENAIEARDLTKTELYAMIFEETGQLPISPIVSDEPRFKSPLLVMSENRTAYMFPIDRGNLVELGQQVEQVSSIGQFIALTTTDQLILIDRLTAERLEFDMPAGVDCRIQACMQFSGDQQWLGIQVEPDTVLICLLPIIARRGSTDEHCNPGYEHALRLSGRAFQFAPNGIEIAVWQEEQIAVYQLRGWNTPKLVAQQPIHHVTGQATWSPDGRWLVYSDVEGLWRWDVYSQMPVLVHSTHGTPLLIRHLSATGRYLAVSEQDTHFYLDIFSGQVLPDGLFKDNDRTLVVFDTVHQTPSKIQICQVLPYECQVPYALQNNNFLIYDVQIQPGLYGGEIYAMLTCDDNRQHCQFFEPGGSILEDIENSWQEMVYLPTDYRLVYRSGDYGLDFSLVGGGWGSIYDLMDEMDGKITLVKALEPLYYWN